MKTSSSTINITAIRTLAAVTTSIADVGALPAGSTAMRAPPLSGHRTNSRLGRRLRDASILLQGNADWKLSCHIRHLQAMEAFAAHALRACVSSIEGAPYAEMGRGRGVEPW